MKKRSKRIWIRKWIELRRTNGVYHQLLRELEKEDPKSFKTFLRMDRAAFDDLADRIRPFIKKSNTNFRNAITVSEGLSIT